MFDAPTKYWNCFAIDYWYPFCEVIYYKHLITENRVYSIWKLWGRRVKNKKVSAKNDTHYVNFIHYNHKANYFIQNQKPSWWRVLIKPQQYYTAYDVKNQGFDKNYRK